MLKLRAWLLSLAFHSERKKLLFFTQKRWGQLLLVLVAILGVIGRAWGLVVTCAALFFLIRGIYRWASRVGYTTFISKPLPSNLSESEPLSSSMRTPVCGTGHFLFGEVERRFLMAQGECWYLPAGDVVFMFEVAPERFAYQFINPNTVESIRFGELVFANHGDPAIEVTFQTDWIAADDQLSVTWGDSNDEPQKKTGKRTTLLSFNSQQSAVQVWGKLVGDTRAQTC